MKPLKRKEGETQQEFNKRAQAHIKEQEQAHKAIQSPSTPSKPQAHKPKAKKKPRKYSLSRHLPHASSNKQKQ